MKTLPKSIEASLGQDNRREIEKIMAGCILFYGMIMIAFPSSFDVPIYSTMHMLINQKIWSIIFVVVGLSRSLLYLVNGNLDDGPFYRWLLSVISMIFIWSPLVASFAYYFINHLRDYGGSSILPGIVLSIGIFLVEFRCVRSLTILRRKGVKHE